MNKRLLDTNVILRYLVQDHEAHARIADKLFDACDRGEVVLVILPAVLAETIFVLESFYELPRRNIADVVKRLLESPGVEVADARIHIEALAIYGGTKLHFVDCVLAATARATGIAVATFDRNLAKYPQVRAEFEDN